MNDTRSGSELLRPRRIGTARRSSAQDKIWLELVLKGKRLGFTLAEIRKLIDAGACDTDRGEPDLFVALSPTETARQIDQLSRRRDAVQPAIVELRQAMTA